MSEGDFMGINGSFVNGFLRPNGTNAVANVGNGAAKSSHALRQGNWGEVSEIYSIILHKKKALVLKKKKFLERDDETQEQQEF